VKSGFETLVALDQLVNVRPLHSTHTDSETHCLF